jgi:hypothetical protein
MRIAFRLHRWKAEVAASVMETNRDDIGSELLAAERAAAAPYIDYPASPVWFAHHAHLSG